MSADDILTADDIPWAGTPAAEDDWRATVRATLGSAAAASSSSSAAPSPRRGPSQATRLVRLARAQDIELWHAPAGDAYLTLRTDGHREHHALASRATRDWLCRLYHREHGGSPSGSAVTDARETLAGIARYDGAEHPVSVRVAAHDGAIYLDRGAPTWDAIAIARDGWRIVADPPVRFRRARGVLALPVPVRGGTIADVAAVLGLAGDDATLVVGWLLGALRPTGPYPVLSLAGEAGTGKSTRARMIRGLVDPHEADLRAEPREVRDLMIAATSGWIVALDNLSRVQDWLSDALCRLATGGALGARTLYTDSDETILSAVRPVIITAIADVAHQSDLLDRCVAVTLAPLDDADRRTEADLWRDYERQRPRLLGALLDAVAGALRREADVRLPILPRMADWAVWVTAAEPACGWPEGTLLRAYAGRRQVAIEALLDGDRLAVALRALDLPWTGTAAELLDALGRGAGLDRTARPPQGWPTSPRGLSAALRRLAPSLRRVGLQVVSHREAGTGGRRLLSIRCEDGGGRPSRPSLRADSLGMESDAKSDGSDAAGFASQLASQEKARISETCDGCDDGDGSAPTFSASSSAPMRAGDLDAWFDDFDHD